MFPHPKENAREISDQDHHAKTSYHMPIGIEGQVSDGHRQGPNLKALLWFWIIDETLVLTSILSVCRLNEVGTCQVMEQVMIMVMTTR